MLYSHYERMRLLNESFERLQANKQIWKKELQERRELDDSLLDGLEEK